MIDLNESFKNRVYYAARDGMAITLYALLSERNPEEVQEVLNQVNRFIYFMQKICSLFGTLAFCWSVPLF